MRTEKNGVSVPSRDRPHVTDPEILPTWRRYTKLRTQLYPYIQAADARYRRDGLPLMRHMALAYPDDPRAGRRDDQFMFGNDLLIAPVVHPGERERQLYLPGGDWVDLGQALSYREEKGQLALGRAVLIEGGGQVEVDAPLEQLPMLARAGAVIPMLPPSVDTLAPDGGDKQIVSLRDRKHRLRLLAFPRGRSRAEFGLGGKLRSLEHRGKWRLAIKGEPRSRYNVAASLLMLKRPIDRPCRLSWGGRRLGKKQWHYSKRRGVLRATLGPRRSAKSTLRVHDC